MLCRGRDAAPASWRVSTNVKVYIVLDSRRVWGGRPLYRYNLRGWVAGFIGSECRMALFSYLLTHLLTR